LARLVENQAAPLTSRPGFPPADHRPQLRVGDFASHNNTPWRDGSKHFESAARRPGDPAKVVAETKLIRHTLGWRPRFDDLSTIGVHALSWERASGRKS
jgi:hypothetical protein